MQSQKVAGGNELLNAEKILKEDLGLTSGSYVGDFGCGGAGYFTIQAAKIIGNGLVYAVDIQKSVLDNIKSIAKEENLNNLHTIWSDLEKFGACKVNDNSLDYGLIINMLFQNENKQNILKECARMVKDEGKILIIDWKEGRFPIGPAPENKISASDITLIAQNLGLIPHKQFEAGQYHYGLIFKK